MKDNSTTIDRVASMIIRHQGIIPYKLMEIITSPSWTELDSGINAESRFVLLIYMSCIARHIPIYTNGNRILRPYESCFRSALTFMYTNKDERLIEAYSNTPNSKLPKLVVYDNSHINFHAGTGKSAVDLYDVKDKLKYEVKFNYFTRSSPSTLHYADRLINCIPGEGIEIYKVKNNEVWDKNSDFISSIKEVEIEARNYNFINNLSAWDNIILFNGTLIEEIDKKLESLGFKWPN